MSLIGPAACGRIAGLRMIDWRPAAGVLVASGSGLMMSIMDAAPCLGWCVDLDTNRDPRAQEQLVRLLEGEGEPLVIAGWFSISDPLPLCRALAAHRAPNRALVYASARLLRQEAYQYTLPDLLQVLRGIPPLPRLDPLVTVGVTTP